jgi:ribonuclease HI
LLTIKKIIVHIDGSSQGNPGPSGIGVNCETGDGKKISEISKYIGFGTNNQAEYKALIETLRMLGTKYLNQEIGKNPKIIIKTDSELLCNQVNGLYKIKDFSLRKLFSEVDKLKEALPEITVELIPREENRICDRLAKKSIKTAMKSGVAAKPKTVKVQTLFS